MKKLAVALLMGLSFNTFAAIDVNPVTGVGPFIFVSFLMERASHPDLACSKEPVRKVAWANNPKGYSFTVAGCDYQAKKDLLVEVK